MLTYSKDDPVLKVVGNWLRANGFDRALVPLHAKISLTPYTITISNALKRDWDRKVVCTELGEFIPQPLRRKVIVSASPVVRRYILENGGSIHG